MKKRSYILTVHWIDSLILVIISSIITIFLFNIFYGSIRGVVNFLSGFGVYGIAITTILFLCAIGFLLPRSFKAALVALGKFTTHCLVLNVS